MANLNYQNPASADAILQSEIADASTSPNTLREKIAITGANADSIVSTLNAILSELRLQNYILIKAFGVAPDSGVSPEDTFAR